MRSLELRTKSALPEPIPPSGGLGSPYRADIAYKDELAWSYLFPRPDDAQSLRLDLRNLEDVAFAEDAKAAELEIVASHSVQAADRSPPIDELNRPRAAPKLWRQALLTVREKDPRRNISSAELDLEEGLNRIPLELEPGTDYEIEINVRTTLAAPAQPRFAASPVLPAHWARTTRHIFSIASGE